MRSAREGTTKPLLLPVNETCAYATVLAALAKTGNVSAEVSGSASTAQSTTTVRGWGIASSSHSRLKDALSVSRSSSGRST